MSTSIPQNNVNAWILVGEDDPAGVGYNQPGSSYQSLIDYKVYNFMNQLDLCFFVTTPTSADTIPAGDGSQYTIQIGNPQDTHPGGMTNLQYMEAIITDSRKINANLLILPTLGFGGDYITDVLNQNTQHLSGKALEDQRQTNATHFANNLVTFLGHYKLNGFDTDWEGQLASATSSNDFQVFYTAIGEAFQTYNSNHSNNPFYLTLSPDYTYQMDVSTTNTYVDWLNLQLYSHHTFTYDFINVGVDPGKLQYGCKFESESASQPQGTQTAMQAYQGFQAGFKDEKNNQHDDYELAINWRVNSGNFHYEQASQIILWQLVNGTGMSFDDAQTMALAQHPPITAMTIRHGNVLDAIQPTNTGSFTMNQHTGPTIYELPQHGGDGGSSDSIKLNQGELITGISGYTGVWYGWDCVLQISFSTNQGRTFGPYGTMSGSTSSTKFEWTADNGESFIAFSGTLVNVPLAGGSHTNIVATLNATKAVANP